MLDIYFGNMPSAIYDPVVFFRNTYDEAWFQDDFAKEIFKRFEDAEVIDGYFIKSPMRGIIPPTLLSSNIKLLLLIKNRPDKVFNVSSCDDACMEFILKLANRQNVTINLRRIVEFGTTEFEARVLNDGSYIHNMDELLCVADLYMSGRMNHK